MDQLVHFLFATLASFLYIAEVNASISHLPIVLLDSIRLLTLVASTVQRSDVCTLSVSSMTFSSHIRLLETFLLCNLVLVEVLVFGAVVRLKLSHGNVDAGGRERVDIGEGA